MTLLLLLVLQASEPISLHPDNPHYLLWRGKPTVLVTSAEHYGAVLNLDFDTAAYLDELRAHTLNHTRLFSGVYREIPGSFGITDNTLAPKPDRYAAPWPRSEQPGASDGGNKFDLARWNDAYFGRLRAFMVRARAAGVVVEFNIFCPLYDDALWKVSPLKSVNNVNGVGSCPRTEVYALKHKDLQEVQEAVTRKLVAELRDFDNLYYEVCNEPYFGGVTMDWQRRIVDVIVDAEKDLPKKHLISLNIANGRAKVKDPHPAVSIFNFHYCVPPDTVAMNYGLNKVIGENETGFRGKADVLYRTEGWDFMLAGGGLYNNLDYSFTTKHAAGDFLDYTSPGGGSPAFRRQLRILKDFLESFDFIRMAPDPGVVRGAPAGFKIRALVEKGRQVALYVHAPPTPPFSCRWTGRIEPRVTGEHTFHLLADDGARLWVDGKLVLDAWSGFSGKEQKGIVQLEAGRKVDLRMEHHQSDGGASARLSWSEPSLSPTRPTKEVVPDDRFDAFDHAGGDRNLSSPLFSEDVALRLRAK